jgi:succinate-semialdehyde dehydrogenase/glutarate-semialdehyde dehydrogenase
MTSSTAAPPPAPDLLRGVPTTCLVDGVREDGETTFPVHDPATGRPVADVADAGSGQAVAALDAAERAFGPWAATPARERAEVLRRAYEIMIAEADRGAALVVAENGKAWGDARSEIVYAAEFFRWFSEEAVRIRGDFRPSPAGGRTIVVDQRPLGVAYLVTPWNFPAAMATRKLAPALAAGCTCVLKPAELTPLTALWIADVLARAGAPAGTVNVLPTTRPAELTATLLADRRLATLSFTGSTEVGKLLLRQAADRVLRCSMELGGNAPFLVLEGADVEQAVAAALVAKMRNGGSACTAANRFYVHESLSERFTTDLLRGLSRLRVGPGSDPANDVGSMVSTDERDKVLALLATAEAEGGTVRTAGRAPTEGAFMAPRVVTDVGHGSTLPSTEVFGPVAPIMSFCDTDDAVRMANDTSAGLISYVMAGDEGTGVAVARRLEAGMVAVNRGVLSDPAAPFGGVKESGLGREGGFEGIHEFLDSRYVAAGL